MSVNLTGILGDLSSALPSTQDVLQNVLVGAGASVVLAGLKTNAGLDAIDPLHIIHKDANGNATSTVVGGKSITVSAFNALDQASKTAILAAGYVVVPG